MPSTPSSSEHRWEGIVARDNARLHSGHVYRGQVNCMYDLRASVTSDQDFDNVTDARDQTYTTMRKRRQTQ